MTEARIAGRTVIAAPRSAVAAALHDPSVLRRMIPGCTALTAEGPGAWRAQIERSAGPVMLRLSAQLVLERGMDGVDYVLTARGRNLVAGSVTLRLGLVLRDTPQGTELVHDGSLEADGLAGRLLRGNEARVEARSDHLFDRLRTHVEATARA